MEKVPSPRLVRSGDVAKLMHVDPKTVARWSKDGKLPTYSRTLGGHRIYDLNVIELLVERLSGNGARP